MKSRIKESFILKNMNIVIKTDKNFRVAGNPVPANKGIPNPYDKRNDNHDREDQE
ncbi:hypothetical protein D3C76_1766230 [compost metagenome]